MRKMLANVQYIFKTNAETLHSIVTNCYKMFTCGETALFFLQNFCDKPPPAMYARLVNE
ncbi:hypothetical protein Psta_2838 [Pirellula staleyi DSM 6068]|uniref:Uncharacterized protein n=1 Tax=Pirellula staleyi (strain ATCC 27377 / DSM 6068 / ICPB 4128) TaxID=530564 RepID=D2R7S8_PIRSD|nr:hypothetical protein Psta_2838 [Pirellula staleyi DSM 6068]